MRKMKGKLSKMFAKAPSSSDEEDEDNSNHYEEDDNKEDNFSIKKWYNENIYLETTGSSVEIKPEDLESLRKEAKSILDGAAAIYSNKPPKSIPESDFKWMKTVMAKGTKSDKIAAYVVLIQDSPVHNLNLLNNMISMVKVGKKEWTSAAETLQELFLSDLLPPNRKLLLFSQQPLLELKKLSGNESKRKHLLLYWFFENQLKLTYRDFVVALNHVAHDTVDANKEKAIMIMFKLLENNPEQESALLSNIVNKLGDQSHKVGSKVIYVLTKLLQVHPNMREVVMSEVEKLIFRNNISKRAQYYSVCFLSQFCLSSNDGNLAKSLIKIYISLFKACIKSGEIDSRMMTALLTGVNRAFPFTQEDISLIQDQIDTIYKVVHYGKPIVAIQALSLLYLMSGERGSISDRFYMVLYKKVSDPRLYNSTHHAMFLSLIYKALKRDKSTERTAAFIKRLLQVSSYLPAPIVCGILLITSEIVASKKKALVLTHQVNNNEPAIGKSYHSDDEDDDDDSGYEHYEDVPLEPENSDKQRESKKVANVKDSNKKNEIAEVKEKQEELKTWRNPFIAPEDRKKVITEYDPYHRNPLYAGADKTALCELYKLSYHYHPSVSVFATNILNGERIKYSGDPIQDFTLIRFLDKFSFKNPKMLKAEDERNETFSKFGRRKIYTQLIASRLKANKSDYLNQHERNIPADEKFIFRYLRDRESKIVKKKKTDEEEESDVESVASDEFEEMIYKMTGMRDDEEIDFLNEAGQLPKIEKGKSGKSEDDSEEEDEEEHEGEEDEDDDDDGDEGEEEMSDAGSFAEDFDGDEVDDEELSDDLLEGSELDESEIPPSLMHLKDKTKNSKNDAKKRVSAFSKKKLFASADEFSELLEQNDYRAGGSQAVSNRENAGVKQLKWEEKRDRGFKRKHQGKNLKKPFNKNAKKAKRRRF